jgi:3',5'-nucleoside bisphosphate phosphatase
MMRERIRRGTPVRDGADLHVHTTHSDGRCSPCDVVRAAASAGLEALAITDHDTLSGLPAAQAEARRLGIEVVPGVELTASLNGRSFHILGYFVRIDDPCLVAATAEVRLRRMKRCSAIVESLQSTGVAIDRASLASSFPRGITGRRQIAEYLVHTGQASTVGEAFTRWLGDEGIAGQLSPGIHWIDAISLIRDAGGVAALAHPPFDLRFESLREWKAAGLQAIEVAGPGISARLGRRWSDWGSMFELVPVGGSDFHFADRPGARVGAIRTARNQLERLRALARSS